MKKHNKLNDHKYHLAKYSNDYDKNSKIYKLCQRGDIYIPVTVNGVSVPNLKNSVGHAGTKRWIEGCKYRASLMDTEGKSVLDFGTNTGYILFELLRNGGATFGVGIDRSKDLINICKEVASLEKLNASFFEAGLYPRVVNMGEEEYNDPTPLTEDLTFDGEITVDKFDVGLLLSLWHRNQIKHMFKNSDLFTKAKEWYIEPTNHHRPTPGRPRVDKKTMKGFAKTLEEFGEVKFLDYTDYQDRGLFHIVPYK